MRANRRKLIVIGRPRPFDEAAFKRLLLAYAYYRHDERHRQADSPADPDQKREPDGRDDPLAAAGSQS